MKFIALDFHRKALKSCNFH